MSSVFILTLHCDEYSFGVGIFLDFPPGSGECKIRPIFVPAIVFSTHRAYCRRNKSGNYNVGSTAIHPGACILQEKPSESGYVLRHTQENGRRKASEKTK